MIPWKINARKLILEDKWITLYADACELENGHVVAPYYVIKEKEWVHVIAINSDDQLLVVRQYCHAAGVVCTEFPGGTTEGDEDPLIAAKRELKEETGFIAESWTKLTTLYANPARQTNRVHCFLARTLHHTGAQFLDKSEEITYEFITHPELLRRIHQGDFHQSLHVSSYFLALDHLKTACKGVKP